MPLFDLDGSERVLITPKTIGQRPERTDVEIGIIANVVDAVLETICMFKRLFFTHAKPHFLCFAAENLALSSSNTLTNNDCSQFDEAAQIMSDLTRQRISVLYPGQQVNTIRRKNILTEALRIFAGRSLNYQSPNGTEMGK